jgi:pyridoxal phosphate enzyme (YggS family)
MLFLIDSDLLICYAIPFKYWYIAMIRENIEKVRGRIAEACKRADRSPDSVRLIAVTKEAEMRDVKAAIESGVREVGENRVQEAVRKQRGLASQGIMWHMIGHLQTNKAKDAVRLFSLIHSVDSMRLAQALDKEAKKVNKVQNLLAQVNTSGEESKFGMKPETLNAFLRDASQLKNIVVLGLMTMAPFTGKPEVIRSCFRKLRELAYGNKLKELSMGMTQDYEIAIEEGATMVRVGSAIFKE